MKKRGLTILGFGTALIFISFGIVLVVFPDSDSLTSEFFVPDLLESMFDYVSDESMIYPGGSAYFTYSVGNQDIPLVWGLQIVDFQDGDNTRINISNIYGDDFASIQNDEPIVFDMFVIEKADVYNFEVENLGNRPIAVVMMFTEDPDNSENLNNPDSPLVSMLLPLAISGIILIVGLIVLIVGAVVLIMDWKKERNQSRYY